MITYKKKICKEIIKKTSSDFAHFYYIISYIGGRFYFTSSATNTFAFLPSNLSLLLASGTILLVVTLHLISLRKFSNTSAISSDLEIIFPISFLIIDDNCLSGATE